MQSQSQIHPPPAVCVASRSFNTHYLQRSLSVQQTPGEGDTANPPPFKHTYGRSSYHAPTSLFPLMRLIMHPHTQAYVCVYVCAICACVCVHAGSVCCVTIHDAAHGARRRVTGAYEYLAARSSADMPSGVLAFASAFFCRAGGASQVCVYVCVCVHI